MAVSFLPLSGNELTPYLDALGKLRIGVFIEYPYLYQGTLEYEREYLQTYVNCPQSLVVLAMSDGVAIGATTCLPMAMAEPEFQEPFLKSGLPVSEYCYFGESILMPEFRGQGIGKEFMRRREAHARSIPGVRFATFCAVDRPENHPRRPANYLPLDEFWQRQGFTKHPELQATFSWKEIGDADESDKVMKFWVKELSATLARGTTQSS